MNRNDLPKGLSQEKWNQAVDFIKLAALSYSDRDKQFAKWGMSLFSGIDDVINQNFTTNDYVEKSREGSEIDWPWVSGLDYVVFEHKHSKNIVLAFRGTEPLSLTDWSDDFLQLFGRSGQYNKAINVAKSLQTSIDDYNKNHNLNERDARKLYLTGHSLGGGLATAASLKLGIPAIVFDAAGVSNSTIQALGAGRNNARFVTNFNVHGDIISDPNYKMDRYTIGSGTFGEPTSTMQYGDIFWLKNMDSQALLKAHIPGAPSILKPVLNHAWHLAAYQLEHKNFVRETKLGDYTNVRLTVSSKENSYWNERFFDNTSEVWIVIKTKNSSGDTVKEKEMENTVPIGKPDSHTFSFNFHGLENEGDCVTTDNLVFYIYEDDLVGNDYYAEASFSIDVLLDSQEHVHEDPNRHWVFNVQLY